MHADHLVRMSWTIRLRVYGVVGVHRMIDPRDHSVQMLWNCWKVTSLFVISLFASLDRAWWQFFSLPSVCVVQWDVGRGLWGGQFLIRPHWRKVIFWTVDIGETIVRITTPSIKVIVVITMSLGPTEHATEDHCCDYDVPLPYRACDWRSLL